MSNEQTTVLFVHRQDAKVVKSYLEGGVSFLDKQFRMAPVADAVPAQDVESVGGHGSSSPNTVSNCIAVPVTADCIQWLRQKDSASDGDASSSGSSPVILDDTDNIISLIVGFGSHPCPYSSSMLGNNNKNRRRAATATKQKKSCQSSSTVQNARCDGSNNETLNDVQYALLETLNAWLESNATTAPNTSNEGVGNDQSIESLVRRLSNQTCPKKLEIMGDDRTLVVPSYSLFIHNSQEGGIVCTSTTRDGTTTSPKRGNGDFRELLNNIIQQKEQQQSVDQRECTKEEYIMDVYTAIQSQLWQTLATFYNSPRVVRRGDIDPESGVRESGHRILWPKPVIPPSATSEPIKGDYNHGFQPTNTGPNSPGWITVTEHKIRQNFDLTRVMFSRGNVTEKKRFGRNLVQPGECVLDMYAGIGYYTLPALIHGQARHVVACEWNSHALYALRYNLEANGVDNRATVLEGDCRISLRGLVKRRRHGTNTDHERESTTAAEINQFDRISLGLLPSCEGGWPVAVSCLNRSTGGWLHVHANVPTIERTNWSHWLCRSLVNIASEQQKEDASMNSSEWIAICIHVEKVKSYAPKVDHIVADVFLGPCDSSKVPGLLEGRKFCSTGVVESSSGRFTVTPCEVDSPSCALDEEGILHQHWMMMMKEST